MERLTWMKIQKMELLAYEALKKRAGCLCFGPSAFGDIVAIASEDFVLCKSVVYDDDFKYSASTWTWTLMSWPTKHYANKRLFYDPFLLYYDPFLKSGTRCKARKTMQRLLKDNVKKMVVEHFLSIAKSCEIRLEYDFKTYPLMKCEETLEELAIEGELLI